MKRLSLLLVIVMLITLLPVPVTAAPMTPLAELAAYYPADTPLFLSMGIMEQDFAAMDTLLSAVATLTDGPMVLMMNTRWLLDFFLLDTLETNFTGGIEPWLGDSVAVGIFDYAALMAYSEGTYGAEPPPVVFAMAVDDRPTLDTFLTTLFERGMLPGEYKGHRYGDFLIYDFDDISIRVSDDVMFIGNQAGMAYMPQPGDPVLSDTATFQYALQSLPEDDYTLLATYTLGLLDGVEGVNEEFVTLTDTFDMGGVFGVGMVDGAGLVVDFAVPLRDEIYEGMPFVLPPVDPNFAANMPADTFITLQGMDFSFLYDLYFDPEVLSSVFVGFMSAGGGMAFDPGYDTNEDPLVAMMETQQEIETTIDEINEGFTYITGMDLETDVIQNMTGSYALYLRADESFYGIVEEAPTDFGLLVEVLEQAAQQRIMDGLMTNLLEVEAEDVAFSLEMIGDSKTLVFTDPGEAPNSEILLGNANNTTLMIGSRPAVTDTFTGLPQGSLADEAAYIAAQQYWLPDSGMVSYINLDAVADGMVANADEFDRAMTEALFSIIDSVSLNVSATGGSLNARLVTVIDATPENNQSAKQ